MALISYKKISIEKSILPAFLTHCCLHLYKEVQLTIVLRPQKCIHFYFYYLYNWRLNDYMDIVGFDQ